MPHLGIAALAAAKGIDIKHIPTKGNPEVIAAILGGDVPVAGGSYPIFKPHVEAGTIKVLGQFCNERDPFLQNVPTLKEQDIDVVIDYWRWVVVSKHTPANQVKVLAAAFKNLLQDKETLANLKKIAVPVSYLPPEEYETMMKKSEVAVSSAIKAAGLEKK